MFPELISFEIETNKSEGSKVGDHSFPIRGGRAAGRTEGGMSGLDFLTGNRSTPANFAKGSGDTDDFQLLGLFIVSREKE